MDVILIPVVLIVIGFSVFFAAFLWEEIKDTDVFPSDPEKYNTSTEIKSSINQTVDLFPYMFVMVLISLIISLLISAYFIPSSPIFLIAGIIIIFVAVIVSVQMANAWETIYEDPTFSSLSSDYEVINLIMDMLPLITFMSGALFLMVLYGKKEQGGGYQT